MGDLAQIVDTAFINPVKLIFLSNDNATYNCFIPTGFHTFHDTGEHLYIFLTYLIFFLVDF